MSELVDRVLNIAKTAAGLLSIRNSYRRVFCNVDGEKVLIDLRRICPTDPTLGGEVLEDKQIFINIGKRQVLSRILAIINMSEDKINALAKAEAKKEIENGRTNSRW